MTKHININEDLNKQEIFCSHGLKEPVKVSTFLKLMYKPGKVVHSYKLGTREAEVGGS
jgi:hypothetical protein